MADDKPEPTDPKPADPAKAPEKPVDTKVQEDAAKERSDTGGYQ